MKQTQLNLDINDTLEEELRVIIVEKQKEIQVLKNEIALLKEAIAQETKEKYAAYKKLAEVK